VKVNLHVHGIGHDPAEIVLQAREAAVDLIAITDHQSFEYFEGIAEAAASAGRVLTVLPGIEITAREGVHLLAIFPGTYSRDRRVRFYGWLEIEGLGDTSEASRKGVLEIMRKVEEDEGGIIIVPHPFTPKIGLLDSSRKLSTKVEWLESGHIRLIQVSDKAKDKINYIGHDGNNDWINRYVLTSANAAQIKSSRYCLAPFGRSDAHSPDEIADGCSWFRMQELSVEGLKQVACEPRTRISVEPPPVAANDVILGLRIDSGYCREQSIRFNEALNCLVGANYAGKSTVLDLVRFAIAHEKRVSADSRERLLTRLNATLGADGTVEIYLRKAGTIYIAKRKFTPQYSLRFENRVTACLTDPLVYRYEHRNDELVPEEAFEFPIEVYEQGRIHDLRSDVHRQLEMLDEFAGLIRSKERRREIVNDLRTSAAALAPLHEERERLASELVQLPTLKSELTEKTQLLPDAENEGWARSEVLVSGIEEVIESLSYGVARLPALNGSIALDSEEPLHQLFAQRLPELDAASVVCGDTLAQWRELVRRVLNDLDAARRTILAAVELLKTGSHKHRDTWTAAKSDHNRLVSERLKQAGVASPRELIDRISALRSQVASLENFKQPRLIEVEKLIDQAEERHDQLLTILQEMNGTLTAKRQEKAGALTGQLGGYVRVRVNPNGDRESYFATLDKIVGMAGGGRIRNREAQLRMVVEKVLPIELARALRADGYLPRPRGLIRRLGELCEITENTEAVLCGVARDIRLLTELATVEVPDTPQILVRRRGEANFADLRTGLSPGEQSAAILTLALQTRTAPLILDQPEDELGYSYVVHLIVPKMLQAKFGRQLMVVTHNANIPVLGDADLVIKMENRPVSENDRRCAAAVRGTFEVPAVTAALLELEGGAQAFQYRQHRYSIPAGFREQSAAVVQHA
jgi:AAA domain